MNRLKAWEQQARQVGYFDDDYTACQLYKGDWDHWQGDMLHGRAQQLLRQLGPFE